MMRVGIGYDIHVVEPGGRLMLGGIEMDSDFGLRGHSDADVVLHAIMDSLLGAAALRDIGYHFPPSEEQFRGASSMSLLSTVSLLLIEGGWRVVNVDCTIVAERPRLAEYVDRMQRAIAGVLGVEPGCVSVKATTNEGVGPEGRGEAISAQAVALLESVG